MCHGLERNSATLHAVLTTVPSRAEVWVDPLPLGGPMRGSHGLPPSLLGPFGKRFRRQTVPHMLTPEACPTRIREVLRLVAPLAPVPKARNRRSNNCPVHHAERDGYFWLRQ